MSVTVIASRRSARTEDDRVLVRRAGQGDEAAFAELYDRHAAGLLGFAQQYVGDRAAAEDVVQQTFLAAFRTLQSGTALQHPRAWLYHVARNNALTVVRDRRPAALGSPLEEELLDRAAAVPAQIEQREALDEVVRDIVALPAQQRAALALFEVGDLSQAEIAEILECTPAQVKALVFQARSALVSRRDARSASCASVRETLLAARGGALNRRLLRHHLRQCEPCTAFRDDLRDGRRRVALLLPVLPAPGLREAVLGAFGAHGHASAASAAVLARPRNPWWIAGGTAATVGAVGLATLAWPGAQHGPPDATTPRAVAATATAEPLKLGAAPAKAAARPAAPARAAAHRQARRGATKAGVDSAPPSPPRRRSPSRASTPVTAPAPTVRPPRTHTPVQRPAPRRPDPAPPRPRDQQPAAAAPPAAVTPPPAAAVTPAVGQAPAAPAPVPAAPSPSAPCTDHSHASEQGLAHGKGHHKC